MSKIGLLVTAFECDEELDEVLKPWIEYQKLGKDEIIISVVSAQFKAYHELKIGFNNEKTVEKLQYLFNNYTVKYLNTPSKALEEWDARNLALEPLLIERCDLIWLWDADEFATVEEIEKAIEFVKTNELTCWFRTYYKNLVFDEKHYIKDFCPPRIFRTHYNSYVLDKYIYYNDVCYKGTITRDILNQDRFPNQKIPQNKFFPLHKSWCDLERVKKKINYQLARWSPPNGNGCSFKIENDKICFDPEYFKRINQPPPEVFEL